jgi:predicted ABC-type transport system involved in lysophospholipase L1 biosynthesis ATPase subunit
MAVVAGLSPTCGSGVAAGCALQDVSLTVRRAHLTLLLGLVGHDELARALADSRHLLIADEPTGQLATETGLANTALR